MKKFMLLGITAVTMFSIVACSSEGTCTCTATIDDGSGTPVSISVDTILEGSKSERRDACDGLESSGSAGGVTSTFTCELD